ncbi:fibronectin type III domain-containing protein [Kribbella monticola]|uniref:fibronectin type III domain-containing protein n=1 Tax=Kribbella monticola TaxID=2185285 RepID=UPI000DD39998|nr:fibronectin type III domain-containing protein [Kribbella monticola]
MRKVPAVAFALLLGASTLTACSSDPVPTGVTIGWADNTHQAVQVSWKDSDAPNRITIQGVVSTSPSYVKYLAASEPNTWAIPASAFPPDGNYKVAVEIGTSIGGVTSKAALSPMFDTDGPLRPTDAVATPTGNDVVVTWKVPPPEPDFSPGDPLDVPRGSQLYVPVVGTAGQPFRVVGPGTTTTRQVVKNLRPPYYFQLRATNEWTSLTGGEILGRTSSTSLAVPTLWTFGLSMPIRGRTVQQEISCAESLCAARRTSSAGLPVVLLGQSKAGGPWVQVGRSVTQLGGYFDVRVNASGTRNFRAYVPLTSRVGNLSTASSSKPALSRSKIQIASALYSGGNVRNRNDVVTAVLAVRPNMNQQAIFQFWNGKAWVSIKQTPIKNGRAALAFRATRPGMFAYRFLVPNTQYLGMAVYGTATGSLVLRVR